MRLDDIGYGAELDSQQIERAVADAAAHPFDPWRAYACVNYGPFKLDPHSLSVAARDVPVLTRLTLTVKITLGKQSSVGRVEIRAFTSHAVAEGTRSRGRNHFAQRDQRPVQLDSNLPARTQQQDFHGV